MEDVFIWFAGGDHTLLEKCTSVERRKYAIYGALILIPTGLAFISMSYALSTLTTNEYIIYTGGVLWALAIFSIDRFIIATTFKSSFFSLQNAFRFFIRILFAVILGITVSHPIVMFFFDEAIVKEIKERHEDALIELEENQKEEELNHPLFQELKELESSLDCHRELLTAEYSGDKVILDCGRSSGLARCGSRCDILRGEISKIEGRIDKKKGEIKDLQSRTDEKIKDLKSSRVESYDYITRVETLELMENESESSHIYYVKIFLMLLFVTIDIIPVVFKATSKMTEYDEIVQQKRDNKQKSFEQQARNEAKLNIDLLERLFSFRSKRFDTIFSDLSDKPTKDLVTELQNELGVKLDESSIGIEKEVSPLEDSDDRPPFSLREALSNPITYVCFAVPFLLMVYYILTNYYLDGEDGKSQALFVALLGIFTGLVNQMAPSFKKEKQ